MVKTKELEKYIIPSQILIFKKSLFALFFLLFCQFCRIFLKFVCKVSINLSILGENQAHVGIPYEL